MALLNNTDPDYHLEEFWLSFKNSMLNYCKQMSILLPNFEKNIILYSDNLNKLKTEKKYEEIESNICNFIMEYALLIIKTKNNLTFHDLILVANIKRWAKLSKTLNNEKYDKILVVFMINLEMKEYKIKNDIDIIKCYNDYNFDEIIKLCFEFNTCRIFNLLNKLPNYNLYDNIRKLYPELVFKNGTKFSKIYQSYVKKLSTFY